MKTVLKRIICITASSAAAFSLAACSGIGKRLDVVGNGSVDAFEAVLNVPEVRVARDETNAGWSLAAPDGAARFIWSEDYSKSPLHDVMLELDAQPFLNAGLDPSKLPGDIAYYDNTLMLGTKLGPDELQYAADPTPLAAYEQIVKLYRSSVSYHMALDHYGVNLGNGNLFEWAKDMDANDKDIVFVLDPAPWIAAGADPNAIDGWAFAKVTVHIDGKPTEVDKILKPFDLYGE